jgi:shikimate kinase
VNGRREAEHIRPRGALPERIFLVGFMGVGKSTVGRALAGRLGYDFVDTDELVEATEGLTIEQLFHEPGEGYFREREWDALVSLAARTRIVAATGGGLFLAPTHQEFIRRHGVSVWLDAPLEAIWARAGVAAGRPLFTTREELARLLAARRDRYALADHRVAAGDRAIDEVVADVLERLGAGPDGEPRPADAPPPEDRR